MNKKALQLVTPRLPVPYQFRQFVTLVDLRNLSDPDWRWLNTLVEVYHPLSAAQWAVIQGRQS